MILEIFTLLVLFQLKHFICDYPLQTQYMLGKMQATGWVQPLAAHAAVHSLATYIITMYFVGPFTAVLFALADFITHFTVDRIKASPKLGGRWNPTQPYFWWALGADQMSHHLTHYLFIYLIISI